LIQAESVKFLQTDSIEGFLEAHKGTLSQSMVLALCDNLCLNILNFLIHNLDFASEQHHVAFIASVLDRCEMSIKKLKGGQLKTRKANQLQYLVNLFKGKVLAIGQYKNHELSLQFALRAILAKCFKKVPNWLCSLGDICRYDPEELTTFEKVMTYGTCIVDELCGKVSKRSEILENLKKAKNQLSI
jgi:hypothetical protein